MRPLALAGMALLGACVSEAAPSRTTPEPEHAPPATTQPCALEGAPLAVPVAQGWALASSPEGCLLVDESAENVALTLVAVPTDLEGAERLETDVRGFVRDSGLLGAAPRFVGRETVEVLGEPAEAQAFVADLAEIGTRAGLAVTRRVGPYWILAILFHAPNDAGARRALVRALEGVEARPSADDGAS